MAQYINFQPKDYFNTKLYTGANKSVTGVGFQPDFTWIKQRNAASSALFDAVRGTTKYLESNGTQAETTDATTLTAFGSDGFTLGADSSGYVGGSSQATVSWNWKAGTTSGLSGGTITPSYYSINTTSGVGIYKYTGTGSAGTIPHGLNSTPRFIMIKRTDSSSNWALYYNPAHHINGQQGRYVSFQTSGFSTDSTVWNGTSATSSVFSVGTSSLTNGTGATYIAYAFADVTGYQKFHGWYANANTNGPFLYCGFKPAFFLMFNINNSSRFQMADNKRSPFNEIDKKLNPSTTSAESTTGDIACDFVSTGIKIRGGSTSDINYANLNMMYGLAIAEHPLVSSNDIPCTAR